MSATRIANAGAATEIAETCLDEARNLLALDRRMNSLGIYIDVHTVRANIKTARAVLETAENSLAREWPRPSDYEQV
jgi:hypothetical protein